MAVDVSRCEKALGIPKAEVLVDIESYMAREENKDHKMVIHRLDEMHKKYRFIEMNLRVRKKRLRSQMPDIKACIDTLQLLKKRENCDEPLVSDVLLTEQAYTKVEIKPKTQLVCLWLGANIMLEYTLDEAKELLHKNLSIAENNLEQIETDIDYLRSQITTTEVNIARVYNWEVSQRKKLEAQNAALSAQNKK